MMLQTTADAEISEAVASPKRKKAPRTPQGIRVLSDQEILSFDTDVHPYDLESIIIAGNPIGLIEALAQAAKKEHHDAYGFVTRHAYQFIFDMAYGDRRKTKGRHGSPLSRLRKDFAHAQRADQWESYRESQPSARELQIKKTDSRKLKEIKRKRGTNGLRAGTSDGVISRFMSNGKSVISARTIKASRLIVKNNQKRCYRSPRGLLNAILGLHEAPSDKLTATDYERTILGDRYRKPAHRNLYKPEYQNTPTRPGPSRIRARDREVLALFPKTESTHGWSWRRSLASLERAVRAGTFWLFLTV